MQEIPSRWDVEVRVNTPDHQVLTYRRSQGPDYMDKSLMEYLIGSMSAPIVKSLEDGGYFN